MNEEQQDEKIALDSIYGTDEAFKMVSDTIYQYHYGNCDSVRNILVQFEWPSDYPHQSPVKVSLDAFCNRNIPIAIKDKILTELHELAVSQLGTPMTFSLIEYVRENSDHYLDEIEGALLSAKTNQPEISDSNDDKELEQRSVTKVAKIKKEQLTKAQKRKILGIGEQPRGWNWVNVVRHLQQTGGTES